MVDAEDQLCSTYVLKDNMYAAVVGGLLIMVMSKTNTFMSDGTINEDAASPELERGAWPVVARKQRGRSGG